MALAKKLRNRLVGLLVLVAVAMILVPAIMDPGQIYHKTPDTIAVDGNGAVTDQSGRMVQGGQDYSDLLAPVESNGLTPEQVAAQNSGKLNVTANTDDNTLPLSQSPIDNWDDVPSASEPIAATQAPTIQPLARNAETSGAQTGAQTGAQEVEQLKRNQQRGKATSTNAIPRAQDPGNQSSVEILKSSRTSSQAKVQSKTQNTSSNKNANNVERLVSSHNTQSATNRTATSSHAQGAYTVQVGVFSSKANADGVISKLKASGISARQVPAVINGRNLIRVYAGNASTREGAEGIARRVQQITGTKGSIVNTAN